MKTNHLIHLLARVNALVIILFVFDSCYSPNSSPMKGQWMEVRRAAPNDQSVLSPGLSLQFSGGQMLHVASYREEGIRASTKYLLEDSILTLSNTQSRALHTLLPEYRFSVQRYDTEQLVLKGYIADSDIARVVYTFLPIEKYNSMTKDEIKNSYSLTQQDSLNKIKNWENYQLEKERKKNNRYAPYYTGGLESAKQYVLKNLRYPADHEGRKMVLVAFTVSKEGTITELSTDIKEDNFYTREAKRVVQSMSQWNPAIVNGQTRDAREDLLIIFEKEGPK